MNLNTPISTHYGELAGRFRVIWEEQLSKVAEKFGAAIEGVVTPWERAVDVPVVYVKPAALVQVADYMKSDSGFGYGFLVDITATDELPRQPRFDVVYQLFSHKNFARIRLKVGVEESMAVPSLVSVWSGANWAEREVWDMYGIRFDGHPDLRRILMDERWVGHPLRKDYPLRGYQIFPLAEQIDPKLLE